MLPWCWILASMCASHTHTYYMDVVCFLMPNILFIYFVFLRCRPLSTNSLSRAFASRAMYLVIYIAPKSIVTAQQIPIWNDSKLFSTKLTHKKSFIICRKSTHISVNIYVCVQEEVGNCHTRNTHIDSVSWIAGVHILEKVALSQDTAGIESVCFFLLLFSSSLCRLCCCYILACFFFGFVCLFIVSLAKGTSTW